MEQRTDGNTGEATVQELPEERLAEIEARADAATPGPWEAEADLRPTVRIIRDGEGDPGGCWLDTVSAGESTSGRAFSIGLVANLPKYDKANDDAAFIAHAREDVPWLLAEVRRLRQERDDWKLRAEIATSRAEAEEAGRDRHRLTR